MGPALLKKITEELNEIIRGAIVSKIHQPTDRLLIFKLFLRGAEHRLLISADARMARMHLTEKRYPNPERPLRFCSFLRKHISNAVIENVRAIENERIAEITLKRKAKDGRSENLTLVVELTGKSANIILVDSHQVVMDALKYFPPESSPRAVSPGLELKPLIGKSSAKETLIEKSGENWNESADLYYTKACESFAGTKLGNDLRRIVKQVEKRLTRKERNLEADITKAKENINNSLSAELLLANFKRLKRGMKEIEVEDYLKSPPEKVIIKLIEKLTPNENIERLYKLAKKGKRTIKLTAERLPAIREELDYLNSLYFSIDEAVGRDKRDRTGELGLVRDELIKAGYIKKEIDKKRGPEKAGKKSEPIERISRDDNAVILIGKSGLGNDLIVKRYAKAHDLWFHALGVPGAHVLLKPGKDGTHTEEAKMEAAGYAAGRSKLAESTKIEVIIAKAEDVKKPKGAKPGMVTVARYKSLMVEPKRKEK